jgi:hypothetical protein
LSRSSCNRLDHKPPGRRCPAEPRSIHPQRVDSVIDPTNLPRSARAERTSVPRKNSPSDHASACIRSAKGLINVRFGPLCGLRSDITRGPRRGQQETHAPQHKASLFDHLVGNRQQLRRDCQPESSRSLKIDHEVKLRRLRDRQIGWFFTL